MHRILGMALVAGLTLGFCLLAAGPRVALLAALAFAIQWVVFVPAWLRQSERFYDLTGSISYLVLIWASWASSTDPGPRGLVVSLLMSLWASRLGLFLFRRVRREGDGRFDEIKANPLRFALAWTLQGCWIALTSLAAWTIHATPAAPLGALDALGVGMWTAGFALETVADRQKAAFRADPATAGRFVDVGLWRWSRHPNYFGEILLWTGIAVIGSSVFTGLGWLGWISPVFVALLLTRVSGIPLLERRADERWGEDPDYRSYKDRTPVLLPWPPRDQER